MKRLVICSLISSLFFYMNTLTAAAAGNTMTTGIARQQNDDTVRTFSVKTFDQLRITGPFVVTITGGKSFSVKASGPSPDLGAMDVSTRNSTLLVQYAPVKRSKNPNIEHGVVNVTITLPILKKAEFMELTRFSIKGFDETDYFELTASSLANGFAELNARKLTVKVEKLSSLVMQGESESLKAYLQGKSSLKGYGLKARSVAITVEGMSNAEIAATEALDVTANGMSNITYKGNPTIRKENDSKSIIKAETMGR